ncbi:MAG: hypothetical protein OZSIB_1371 [Candidatus Ozemobacter sibiricus]|uniref:Putative regulatory protein FmdB zinc ribbon domain-containing protein n=1 Tax=Candidatus Ozemobacter sibiricus TaxID=2268124 RepID=A0A367ZM58_9BACT|nr:MAG: hypothetical protein OZSIB_1371 [Candidatus Ozemobacter sibiricus]
MPIYEFICEDCQKTFEVLCSLKTDLSTIVCEHCSGRKVAKKVSRFATGGGTKSLDLGGGGHDHGGGSSCGSCSTHSCGTCGH